jgi:hypothetical protein
VGCDQDCAQDAAEKAPRAGKCGSPALRTTLILIISFAVLSNIPELFLDGEKEEESDVDGQEGDQSFGSESKIFRSHFFAHSTDPCIRQAPSDNRPRLLITRTSLAGKTKQMGLATLRMPLAGMMRTSLATMMSTSLVRNFIPLLLRINFSSDRWDTASSRRHASANTAASTAQHNFSLSVEPNVHKSHIHGQRQQRFINQHSLFPPSSTVCNLPSARRRESSSQ